VQRCVRALGQTAAAHAARPGPVHVTRTPPNTAQLSILYSSRYPRIFRVCKDLSLLTPSLPNVTAASPGATAVPKDFHPRSDMPMTPTAQAAVSVSERWLTEATSPAPGPDGRVVYTYGAGLPTVVCAPLRVCIVELQAGEQLAGEPQIGDSVRWNIAPALYGKADSQTTLIVIKPLDSGLDTNLLITTDRRAYYLRLISKPVDYIARISFAYPNDAADKQAWKEHELRAAVAQERQDGPSANLGNLHFDYEIKAKNSYLKPVQVFDDGSKTYIRMSPDTAARELPVLVAIGREL
jgi:P-type conjugative transfer protein TrbG